MTRTATHQITIKTIRIFHVYVISCIRIGILSLIILLVSGCTNSVTDNDNIYVLQTSSGRLQKTGGAFLLNNEAGNTAGKTNAPQPNIEAPIHTGTDNADDANSPGTRKTLPDNNMNPAQSFGVEYHIDVHDAGEEENVIDIAFPTLMRMAIMMLLIVMII